MKTKNYFSLLILLLFTLNFASCNSDDEGLSKKDSQQALSDIKGTYNGVVNVANLNKNIIFDPIDASAVSGDYLKINLPLSPIAESITDENTAALLRRAEIVEVTSSYRFLQRDNDVIHFVLHPEDAFVGEYGGNIVVKIVFSQAYGGDAEVDKNFIMFNLKIDELWVNGKKLEGINSFLFHFKGEF